MENLSRLNEALRQYVNPPTFPVAVHFFRGEEPVPPRARRPKRDLAVTVAPCQGAAMARRYGWTVVLTQEDVGCAIAAHTYGWERASDPQGAIAFLIRMNYAANEDAARKMVEGFRTLPAVSDLTVVYAPLGKMERTPDVILIYVEPAQLMRLIHGFTYARGEAVAGSFSGRAATCTEGVIGAFLDQRPKVVVPGNGDRVWAGCQDHEMALAFPGSQLEEVVLGLQKTHEQGIRYPIPTYLRYQPEVALSLPLSDIFKPEEHHRLKK